MNRPNPRVASADGSARPTSKRADTPTHTAYERASMPDRVVSNTRSVKWGDGHRPSDPARPLLAVNGTVPAFATAPRTHHTSMRQRAFDGYRPRFDAGPSPRKRPKYDRQTSRAKSHRSTRLTTNSSARWRSGEPSATSGRPRIGEAASARAAHDNRGQQPPRGGQILFARSGMRRTYVWRRTARSPWVAVAERRDAGSATATLLESRRRERGGGSGRRQGSLAFSSGRSSVPARRRRSWPPSFPAGSAPPRNASPVRRRR